MTPAALLGFGSMSLDAGLELEPLPEQAMAIMADLLSDLSGVRPGGWVYPRVPRVDRVLPPPDSQLMASVMLPRLCVVPGRLSQLRTSSASRTSRVYQYGFHVDVHIMAEATADTDEVQAVMADRWRWRLRQDVLEILHRNTSLHGVAQGMDFTERAEEVDAGETPNKVWLVQPVTVFLFEAFATAAA